MTSIPPCDRRLMLDRVRDFTRFIKGRIVYESNQGTLTLTLTSGYSEANDAIPGMIEDLANNLSEQLYRSFFIEGEIVEKGKN